MGLTEFLTARLAEDEAAARNTLEDRERMLPATLLAAVQQPDGSLITLGDPARVLREVEAKRAILAEHEDTYCGYIYDHPDGLMCVRCADADRDGVPYAERPWPCQTLRAVAAVYSDHPDYDEAWKSWKGPWPGE